MGETKTLVEYSEFYSKQLLLDVLPFWMKHGIDPAMGFFTSLDQFGNLLDSDKSVWAQGRGCWMFGKVLNTLSDSKSKPNSIDLDLNLTDLETILRDGISFLEKHCFDPTDGRMWFQVAQDGTPIRKRRYSFSESFASIAFAEAYRFFKTDHFKELAKKCLDEFLLSGTRVHPFPKSTNARKLKSIGFPMISIVTAQELRESIGLENANTIIDDAIEEIKNDFVCEQHAAVLETVYMKPSSEQFQHHDGRQLNPGHAIEAAWFILEEGKIRKRQDYIELGLKILDWMWELGWDKQHGGILYFVDVLGKPVQEYWQDMKFWWPHNETIIATLLAFQLTGDTKYQQWHQLVHDWSFGHFADPENGEWFGYLHRDGTVAQTAKGNLWKGPFHLPRMLYKCWQMGSAASDAAP